MNLKVFFEKFRGTKSNGLVLAPFLCAVAKLLGAEDKVENDFLTELYRNLSLKTLSARENSQFRDFSALRDVIVEINIHLWTEILKDKSKRGKKKKEISKKFDFLITITKMILMTLQIQKKKLIVMMMTMMMTAFQILNRSFSCPLLIVKMKEKLPKQISK